MTKTVTFNGTKYPVEYGMDSNLPFIRVNSNKAIIDVVYLETLDKMGIGWKYDGIDIDALPKGKYESNAYDAAGKVASPDHRTFLHFGGGDWREVSLDQSVTEGESVKATVQDYADRGLLYQLRLGALAR